MENKIQVKVLKRHFDRAIKLQTAESDICSTCLVAQAVQEHFPLHRIGVSYTSAEVKAGHNIRTVHYDLDTVGRKLVIDFDCSRDRKVLRDSLPVEITLTLDEDSRSLVLA